MCLAGLAGVGDHRNGEKGPEPGREAGVPRPPCADLLVSMVTGARGKGCNLTGCPMTSGRSLGGGQGRAGPREALRPAPSEGQVEYKRQVQASGMKTGDGCAPLHTSHSSGTWGLGR